MENVNTNTIMYRKDSPFTEMGGGLSEEGNPVSANTTPYMGDSTAPDFFEEPEEIETESKMESETDSEAEAKTKIGQSNYLRYLSELRKADSELALAKAESAELVRLMDSYREHYSQYEDLVLNMIRDNNSSVGEQLEALTILAKKIKKTSASLDAHIEQEIQRLTKALSESIEGSVRQSCEKELTKVSEATAVLYDYSAKVKSQYQRFTKLEGFKFALFIISSLSSPIVLILMILNLLHII